MNKNVAKSIKSVLANMALLVFCLIYLSPIYIIVVNSFKSRAEMYTNVLALPETLTWEYYAGAVQRMDFINVFKNSLIVTLCSVAVIVVLCAMAAWMLVRTHTRLSRFLYSFLIVTMLIPFQTVMMPLMPVSYTHLDVYKRQVLIRLSTMWVPRFFPADKLLLAIANFLCALGVLILYTTDRGAGTSRGIQQAIYYGAGIIAMLACIFVAVSYTHLDVYKRQAWGCGWT